MPRSKVGILQDHPTTWGDQAEITRELIRSASQGSDLEPAMHEVEVVRLKPTVEQIVMSQRHVPEMILRNERASRIQKFRIEVGARDGAVWTDPLTQEPKPTEASTADVDHPQALTAAEPIEQRKAGRLPHARLELEAFKLRHLTGQEIGGAGRSTSVVLLPTGRQPT